LFYKTEVRREGLNLVPGQFARDVRHRRPRSRMISFAPLLQSSLQVHVRQPPQTGNFTNALGIRAMASYAGRNVGIWNSLLINRSSSGDQLLVSVVGGLWGYRRKINGEI